jgi:hypothetical protein
VLHWFAAERLGVSVWGVGMDWYDDVGVDGGDEASEVGW